MNPYLKSLREKYEGLRTAIETLQTRASESNEDLTEEQLRSIHEMGKQGKELYTQIEELTDIEERNAKVRELSARIHTTDGDQAGTGDHNQPGDAEHRSMTGSTATRDRDPGHYRSPKDGGRYSFFSDLARSRIYNDEQAQRRITEHTRALDTTVSGAGAVPPNWLAQEFAEAARQGRYLAAAVRQFPLGDDPRPLTLPRQVGQAGATTVTEQATENAALAEEDAWSSDVDVVTPRPTAGKQTVSRQMIDMSNPAIDTLIYSDLLGEYNRQIESKVGAAILAAGPAPIGANQSVFGDLATPDTNGSDLVISAGIAVRSTRFLPANIIAMTVDRWGEFLKLKDGNGRPMIPADSGGPFNVIGVGSVAVDGRIHGYGVIATDGMDAGVAGQDSFAVLRSMDTVLFESNLLRFRFEEVKGPESIELGIWGYTAVLVRYAATSVQVVQINTTL